MNEAEIALQNLRLMNWQENKLFYGERGNSGKCKIDYKISEDDNNIVQLTPNTDPLVTNKYDYYFSYSQRTNPGHVIVTAPTEGTIVFTSSMNGCSLVIVHDKKNNKYLFIHDNDGDKCYIDQDWYQDFVNQSENNFDLNTISSDMYFPTIEIEQQLPLFQFVCVFHDGVFKVLCYGFAKEAQGNKVVPISNFEGFEEFGKRLFII